MGMGWNICLNHNLSLMPMDKRLSMKPVSKFSVDSTLYRFVRLRMHGLVTKSNIIYNVTNVQEVVVVRSGIVTGVSRVVSG